MLYRKVRHHWGNFAFRDKLKVRLQCTECLRSDSLTLRRK